MLNFGNVFASDFDFIIMLSKLTSALGEKLEKFVKLIRGDSNTSDKPLPDTDPK